MRSRFKILAVVVLVLGAIGLTAQAADSAAGGPDNPLLSGRSAGDDATAISLDPALSALCQSFIGGPNPYADPAPNLDEIVGDAIVSVGSQTGCSTAQDETTIDVNPSNPLNLVAGANDYRNFNSRENRNDSSGWAYSSFDGGATWTDTVLPHLTFQTGATGALSDMDGAGDPAVAFGRNNTVYYANIAFSRLNDGSAITVSKSTDGGLTWGEPSIVQLDGADSAGNPLPSPYFNDKEWIAVDQNSGAVYVTWTRYGPSGSPIVVSKSTDGGATWSPFVEVNGTFVNGLTPYSQGSNPKVGPHGELYIAYESAICQTLDCNSAGDHDATIVATSKDGGATFTNTEVAPNYDFPFNEDVGDLTLTGENFRINSFPQLTIDAKTGRLWLVWADDRNGQYDSSGASVKTNGDAFLTSSANGKKWERLTRLGTSSDEVFPAVAAYDNRVMVSYYTRAYDSNGIGLDFAYSTDKPKDGVTRITSQTQNPQVQFVGIGFVSGNVLQGEFIGDYTAVAMGSDLIAHPSWTDFRGRPGTTLPNQDAYTQAISLKPGKK
jgi:hypothetical protein